MTEIVILDVKLCEKDGLRRHNYIRSGPTY